MKYVILPLTIAIQFAVAQQYVISTAAGGGPMPNSVAAANVTVLRPTGLAADSSGNLYVASQQFVFRIDASGLLTVVAGTAGPVNPGGSGDGGPATSALLSLNLGVATDQAGNLFIVDTENQRVRKVTPDGTIATVAGNGTAGYSGDNGPATSAALNNPYNAVVDASGNVFIADFSNNRVRMVSADGVITTVAGNGIAGSLGDGGPASSAQLLLPSAVALDSSGNLYIAEAGGQRIRKVSPDGTIVTVAGNGHFGYSGDGGPATSAMLDQPEGVALDASGNLYIADSFNQRIRKVGTDGVITTVAGTGVKGYSGDGGPATSALLWIPNGVVVDASGNLYIADEYNQRVRRVGPDGAITTIAGDGTIGYYGDGGPATSALIGFLYGIAVDGSGNFFFSNGLDWRVSEVSSTSVIRTVAGNGTPGNSGDGGNATSAQLDPHTVSLDVSGNLYISDTSANCVRKVSLDGTITTVAGNGNAGYSGDGGQAINARLNDPAGLAVDPSGNLYIGDALNYRVRKIATDGTITTFAGTGVSGFSGDGGSAVNARLTIPGSLAADDAGNVFIADGTRVRRVSSDGIIRTVAGNGTSADSGDGGPATQAALNTPSGIAVDSSGNLFIAETRGERIRVVSAGTGIINTIAGNGTSGYSGDGGPAISAQLNSPDGLAVDSSGNIYVTDFWNRVIRLLQPVTGLTTSSTQTISSAHPKSLP